MWQALSTARWIPFSTPDPDRPLTNGNFAALFGHGFDWVILNSPGVSLTPPGTARGAEIELSGDQAESCTLLQQWVAIGPDRRYRLQWNVDYSSFSSAPSGMAWHVRGPKLNLQSPDLRADERPVWDFDTPPDTRIGLLTLEYKRPLGETKARGDLALKTVSLQPR